MDSAIGIVGALLGVAGLIVGYLGIRQSKRQVDQRLGYRVESFQVVGELSDPTGRLKVVYEDPTTGDTEQVDSATLTSVRLLNIGRVGIEGNDRPNSDIKGGPLSFEFGGAKPIGRREDIGVKATDEDRIRPEAQLSDDGVLSVDFDHLKSGDSIEINVLHTGEPNPPDRPLKGELLTGSIINLSDVDVSANQASKRRRDRVIGVTLGVLGSLGAAVTILAFLNSPRDTRNTDVGTTSTTRPIEEYEVIVFGPVSSDEADPFVRTFDTEPPQLDAPRVVETIVSGRPETSSPWSREIELERGWHIVEIRRLGDSRNNACIQKFETARSNSVVQLTFQPIVNLEEGCSRALTITRDPIITTTSTTAQTTTSE